MKIAFVATPRMSGYGFNLAEDCCWGLIRSRYLPAALLAAASQMENAFFFDLTIEPPENLEALKPDLIVYSLFPFLPNITKNLHSIMSRICEDVPKIVLAVPPGYMEDYARLEPNPFCVVYSEPEAVFSDFHVTSKDELIEWRSHSRSTAWLDDEGLFHKTEPLRTCLHDVKGTNWDLVPSFYWFHYDIVIYQVTRGCPWRCNFCVWGGSTVTDLTFRMRPAEQVATDLTKLRGTINKYLHLTDVIPLQTLSAQLTTDIRWIREYHSLMDHPYPFQGNLNLRELTEENVKLLSQAGMNVFYAGMEALADPLLKRLNKPHDFEDIVSGLKILNEADVNYSLKMLSGGYGETKREIRESLDNIEIINKRGIDHGKITMGGPIVYYKGTVIAKNPSEKLAYDPRHKAFRQRHIHVDEWLEVRAKLKEYNLLDEVNSHYPVERLRGLSGGLHQGPLPF